MEAKGEGDRRTKQTNGRRGRGKDGNKNGRRDVRTLKQKEWKTKGQTEIKIDRLT